MPLPESYKSDVHRATKEFLVELRGDLDCMRVRCLVLVKTLGGLRERARREMWVTKQLVADIEDRIEVISDELWGYFSVR